MKKRKCNDYIYCHCGRPAVLRSADAVCKVRRPGAMAYVCSNYPACDSFVLAHPDTLEPMGTLAGPELRRLRYEAHRQFNRLYESGLMSRQEAYRWLSYIVQAPMAHAHIGHLGEYYCKVVIDKSKKMLAQLQRTHSIFDRIGGGGNTDAHRSAASQG